MVWVHLFILWPVTDSLSLPASVPFPLSLSVPVTALFSVSVPRPLTVFSAAAVVRGGLGAPLQRQMLLSIAGNLRKYIITIFVLVLFAKGNAQTWLFIISNTEINAACFPGKSSSHVALRPWQWSGSSAQNMERWSWWRLNRDKKKKQNVFGVFLDLNFK